jgi:SAM-dependent methyltransferase
VIERSDGYIDPSEHAPKMYFDPFNRWPGVEKKAIRFAKGKVLDIGCGPGRVALYLQNRKKLDVLGIDNSPLAIKVAKKRGLRKTRLLSFHNIDDFKPNSFDTIIMFGNNFGLFASKKNAKRLLKKLFHITSQDAKLICESRDPYDTDDPVHLSYQKANRVHGRMSGQLRIRARYKNYNGNWFDYLIVSPREMEEIVRGTGWKVDRFIRSKRKNSPIYIGIIHKAN